MFQRALQAFRNFDWLLLGSAVLLSGLGLLALYSIGLGLKDTQFIDFKKQIVFFIIGVGLVFMVAAAFHYQWLGFATTQLYLAVMLALLAVLAFGRTIRGTTGWLYVGPFGFQPMEAADAVLIVIMAKYLVVHGRHTKELRVVVQSAVTVALMILLVVLQPSLGGAIVLAAVWFAMVAASGMKASHVLTMVVVAALIGATSWSFILRPYQKDRIIAFTHPSSDPFGSGYNVTQSVIAIGAGQLNGRGIASGSQSQLRFLPEAPTDFIFSVIAEELGFVGVSVLIGLLLLMFWRFYALARTCRDDFAMYFVIGTAALIGTEAFVNIGVAAGLLPVTGLTLPFVSYGGSSLLMHFLLIAVVENIAMRRG